MRNLDWKSTETEYEICFQRKHNLTTSLPRALRLVTKKQRNDYSAHTCTFATSSAKCSIALHHPQIHIYMPSPNISFQNSDLLHISLYVFAAA